MDATLAYQRLHPQDHGAVAQSIQDSAETRQPWRHAEAIFSVSKHLGLRVVAEGVETREQADLLLSHGCDCLQG